jgi:hypothetical protein
MAVRSIFSYMPDFYQLFLSSEFNITVPEETATTCSDCAMWSAGDENFPNRITFSKESKCCTHYPNLPNYLVGALLDDENPAQETGKSRLLNELKRRTGTLPHGLFRPRKFDFLIRHSPDSFGRSTTLICPFYERKRGFCTVWSYRNSMCGTWFCKYVDGEDGRLFWLTLRQFLLYAEESLSRYAMMKAEWPTESILYTQSRETPLSAEEMDEKPMRTGVYEKLWQKYAGREEEWYRESYRILQAITPDEFLSIIGVNGRILMDNVFTKLKVVSSNRIPRTLKRNPELKVIDFGDDSYTLTVYSTFDPVTLSKRMYEILDIFTGKKTTDGIIEQLIAQGKPVPDYDVILLLYRYRFLVNASEKMEVYNGTDQN